MKGVASELQRLHPEVKEFRGWRAARGTTGRGREKKWRVESFSVADELIQAQLREANEPQLAWNSKMTKRGYRGGMNWGRTLKPFKTDTGVTVRTVNAGDGIAHKLYDGKQMIGHISGFASDVGKHADNGPFFHVYRTEISDEANRGKGHWQSTVQHLAKLYPGGVHLTKFDTSRAAQKATRKIPGVIEDDDRFIVRGAP